MQKTEAKADRSRNLQSSRSITPKPLTLNPKPLNPKHDPYSGFALRLYL